MQEGAKKQGHDQTPKRCFLCQKNIEPGEEYHEIVKRGKRFFHVRCYEQEVQKSANT